MPQCRSFLVLIVLTLLSLTTDAADRWYEVEVLVFAHAKPDMLSEKWPVNDAGPQLNNAVMINTSLPTPAIVLSAAASQADATTNANDALKVSVLSAARLQMKDALKTLSRSRNYRVLLHTGWRQAISAGKDAFKVRLAAGKDFSADYGSNGLLLNTGAEPAIPFGLWELDGAIKLSASNFLRVESDLVLRALQAAPANALIIAPVPAASSTTSTTTGTPTPDASTTNLTWQNAETQVTQEQLQFYRLNQSRRVKAKEVNYFDHPLFGMIIELRPLEGRNEADTEAEE